MGVLIDGAGARAIVAYPELAERCASERAGRGERAVPEEVRGRAGSAARRRARSRGAGLPAVLVGDHGLKKGVAVSHRALLAQMDAYGDAISAKPGDRIVSWLPLYHDMGLITCLFLPLLRGVPVVAMSPFDWVRRPSLWPRAASEHGATLAWLPNFAYAFMAEACATRSSRGWTWSLRGVVNCSEPIMASSHGPSWTASRPTG